MSADYYNDKPIDTILLYSTIPTINERNKYFEILKTWNEDDKKLWDLKQSILEKSKLSSK